MPPLSPRIPEEISLSFQITRGRISEAAHETTCRPVWYVHKPLFHVLGAHRLTYARSLRGRFIDKIILSKIISITPANTY